MPSQLTFQQVKPFVEADLRAGKTPTLLGEPGIGKSSLIEGLSRTFKTKVFTLPVNQLADRSDLTGVRSVQNPETGNWYQIAFPHATIMEAIEYAAAHPDEHPILFMDEFNRASQDITSSILSFVTLRRVGTTDFPANLRLMVAGNDKGNVNSIDKASVSRFAVYRVRPDLDTFLAVNPGLNPFVTQVLTQYPEDLMANEAEGFAKVVDTDSDDDDETNAALSEFEFLGEESFAQITCPRTIEYVSDWLGQLGIDKSGSDKERTVLAAMFSDMTEDKSENILFAGIEAHVGHTTFAFHLLDAINTYFNSLLSQGHTSSQPVTAHLRPKQDDINALSRAADTQAVEALVMSMSEAERVNALVWLTENTNVREVDNNNAVIAFMINAPEQVTDFDTKAIQNLMKVLSDAPRISEPAVKALLDSKAPVMTQWRGVIASLVETD